MQIRARLLDNIIILALSYNMDPSDDLGSFSVGTA